MSIDIITCPGWKARKPKAPITVVGKADKILIHHTAGHHPEISVPQNESVSESIRYAQAIQNQHMDANGWIDSGHNFLVCRNGMILQGRWLTVSAIEAGHMVESAHCPGQNTQIGIEHEHLGSESMTPMQLSASAHLIAWISKQYHLNHPLPLYPHNHFFNTACPANLETYLSTLSRFAQEVIDRGNV